jgi:hypothetical protein
LMNLFESLYNQEQFDYLREHALWHGIKSAEIQGGMTFAEACFEEHGFQDDEYYLQDDDCDVSKALTHVDDVGSSDFRSPSLSDNSNGMFHHQQEASEGQVPLGQTPKKVIKHEQI